MPAVTPTPIPLFTGTFPDPSNRSTYGILGRAVWDHEMNVMVPAINTAASQTNQNTTFAAQMANQAASTAGFVGLWEDQTGAAAMPMSVLHEDDFYVLLQDVADITAHEPGVSVVWGVYVDAATMANSAYQNATSGLAAENGQDAIDEVVARVNLRVTQTSTVGSARLPAGTTAQRPATGLQAGDTRFNTTLGQSETWNGTEWVPEHGLLLPQVALSGLTAYQETGIPAWVNRLRLSFRNLRTNGTSLPVVRIGVDAGVVSSSYLSSVGIVTGTAINNTTGQALATSWISATTIHGSLVIERVGAGSNSWEFSGQAGVTNLASNLFYGGSVDLGAPMSRFQLTTLGGADLFHSAAVCSLKLEA